MCGQVFDDVSDAIGTGGGDQGLLNALDEGVQSVGSALADVDPGPAIGDLGSSFDDMVIRPITDDPVKAAAMALAIATGNAYLVPIIAGADTALEGGSIEDVIKSAAIAYVGQEIGGEISDQIFGGGEAAAFTGATETGLATLPSEAAVADAIGATLLTPEFLAPEIIAPEFIAPEFGPSYADLGYNPAMPMGPTYTEMGYNPPMGPSYADLGIEQFGPSYGDLGIDSAPIYDFSPETAIQSVSPELDPTGSLASSGVKITDLLRAASAAKGLLGGKEQAATAGAKPPTFDSRIPQGQVDYSGILNLLQIRSPQRTSLL